MTLVKTKYCIFAHRSVRRGGRVTSEYLGSGLVAVLRAAEEEERRAAALARRERHEAMQRECDAIAETLAGLAREAKAEARALLESTGHYQHDRGQWRRRGDMSEPGPKPEIKPADRARRRELQRRSTGGNYIETFTLQNMISFALGKDATRRQFDLAWQDLGALVAELSGPAPTGVEALLARSAASDWLATRSYQARLAATENAREVSGSLRDQIQKTLDKTTRRMLASIKMLSVVRRLALPPPPVQIAVIGDALPRRLEGKPGRPRRGVPEC
jgi:hypothetical protein